MNQGDIVITNYPYTSHKEFKIRPALIVSNDKYNLGLNRVLLPISTKENSYSKPLNQEDLEEGFLEKSSCVRFSNIVSIHKGNLFRKVAKLKKPALGKIVEELIKSFK